VTRAFAIYFKHKSGCAECLKLPGKRMCSGCRETARVGWHKHVATRHEKGLCISCPRKHKPGEQRCRTCAEENRTRCLEWAQKHSKSRYKSLRSKGLCATCREPSGAEHAYCEKCRRHQRERARGERTPSKKQYKYLSLVQAAS
jgi:hypothetical protein